MHPAVIVFVGAVGMCFGSFLNVVAYRVPRGRSVVAGRSGCPACDAVIAWYDDIPVVSWVLLRGRCRRCDSPISGWYPAGEVATGMVFAVAAWRASSGWTLAVLVFAATALMTVAALWTGFRRHDT